MLQPIGLVRGPKWERLNTLDYRHHTVARIYQRFWGKKDISLDFGSENTILLNSEELRETRGVLYVFSQYSYLQKRIDKFRAEAKKYRESKSKGDTTDLLAPENPSVVITGTPGTGEAGSTD